MSGILDNKSRVIDTIVTLEGRRQIAAGKMRIEYVSFTDAATFYEADAVSGSTDATNRTYLEQCNLPQDQITFEADDSGRLLPFRNSEGISLRDGRILGYTFDATMSLVLTGASEGVTFLTGSEFASTAESLLASSTDNFQKLRLLGTRDPVFEDDGFGVGNRNITFTITNEKPLKDDEDQIAHVNHLESLFNDTRLSKVKNFKYLPPINKRKEGTAKDVLTKDQLLGSYAPWGRSSNKELTGKQLDEELTYVERNGYERTITFDPTSRFNRLMCQFFEVNRDTIKKLDVIDFGKYVVDDALKHAFFIGKILVDDNGSQTFIHLFTLVFG